MATKLVKLHSWSLNIITTSSNQAQAQLSSGNQASAGYEAAGSRVTALSNTHYITLLLKGKNYCDMFLLCVSLRAFHTFTLTGKILRT